MDVSRYGLVEITLVSKQIFSSLLSIFSVANFNDNVPVMGVISAPNSVATPTMGTPSGPASAGAASKPGMSPMSPLTSVEGPRSQHGPASVGVIASPASVSSNYMNKSVASVEPPISQPKVNEASAIVLNLVLSDSVLNVFRDHNFDSCTMCVCSNEGNIYGRDASSYLPHIYIRRI